MPFEKFERPPEMKPEGEKERKKIKEGTEETPKVKRFTEAEIRRITESEIGDLENLSAEILEKINIENIDSILDSGAEKIARERQKLNRDSFKNLEEGMEQLSDRSSAAHMLLCAVNGKEDLKAFRDTIERFTVEKEAPKIDEKISYLIGTTDRQIKMEEISEELFKIDLKRRIGKLKKDNSFFLKSIPQIENTAPQLSEVLEYFKKEEIQSKSKEIRDLVERIEENLNTIRNKKTESMRNGFYGFCLDVAKLRFIDFQGLNETKMRKTVKELMESHI